MTVLVQDFPVNLPTGPGSLPVQNVPDGLTSGTMRMRRCTTATPAFWPNANTILGCKLWMSTDNGANWTYHGGFDGSAGGIRFDRGAGVELDFDTTRFDLPPVPNRKVRFDFSVQNGPLVSEVTLEVV